MFGSVSAGLNNGLSVEVEHSLSRDPIDARRHDALGGTGEVDLIDYIQDEPSEMIFGRPVVQVGRQEERLVAIAAQQVVGRRGRLRISRVARASGSIR